MPDLLDFSQWYDDHLGDIDMLNLERARKLIDGQKQKQKGIDFFKLGKRKFR